MKYSTVIIFAAFLLGCFPAFSSAQDVQRTENKADQTLRSTGRVNPSTLGMEFDLALGSYPARGITLPINLSYSSKLWRLEAEGTVCRNPETRLACRSIAKPVFSENAAAGWTTSLAQPYVEYVSDGGSDSIYYYDGLPYDSGSNRFESLWSIQRVVLHLPGGGSHELRLNDTAIADPFVETDWNGWYYAADASGIKYYHHFESDNSANNVFKVLLPDGSQYQLSNQITGGFGKFGVRKAVAHTDRNGNQVQYRNDNPNLYPNGYWLDTLGRKLGIPVVSAQPPGVYEFKLPGVAGGSQPTYKLHWKLLKGATPAESALTDFTQNLKYWGQWVSFTEPAHPATESLFISGNAATFGDGRPTTVRNHEPAATAQFNPALLTAIELPDGSRYEFGYNLYGEIESVKYPTGGEERFEYNLVQPLANVTGAFKQANRAVTKRRIYENGASATQTAEWSYSALGANDYYAVTTTAPDNTKTERLMHRQPRSIVRNWGYDDALAGRPQEERVFSTAGALLSRKLTKWTVTQLLIVPEGGGASGGAADWHPRVTSEESIIYDSAGGGQGLATKTVYEYDGDLNQRETPLNVREVKQYDFVPATDGAGITLGSAPAASPTEGMTLSLLKSAETDYLNTTTDSGLAALRAACGARNLLSLPVAARIKNAAGITVSQSELRYDEADYSPEVGRCNATSSRSWDNMRGDASDAAAYLVTQTKFDQFGNAIEATDARGSKTTIEYSAAYNYAFPTKVTTPAPGDAAHGSADGFVTTTAYDFDNTNKGSGLPLSMTDANGQTTTIEYDAFLRPVKTIPPSGGAIVETSYGVPDAATGQLPAAQRFVKTRQQITANQWSESWTWFDGLGRTVKSQSKDDAGDVFVETRYDAMSRPFQQSNPYRAGTPEASKEWTTTVFDEAGRVKETITPDGAKVQTSYGLATTSSHLGTVVTVTDQALKERRSITNALGQLARVDEPTLAGLGTIDVPNQPTGYLYDALGNLTTVTQTGTSAAQCGGAVATCTQTRSFVYDSLSRLLSATNPESGAINYTYDANGNLKTKTADRIAGLRVKTVYEYDALNRVVSREYMTGGDAVLPSEYATPRVDYFYDGTGLAGGAPAYSLGKLSKVESAISATTYTAFDAVGRVLESSQTTDSRVFNFGYSYNLAGMLVSERYPSGRIVRTDFDQDGELAKVNSIKGGAVRTFASDFAYTAAGAVKEMRLGNNRWETATFNSRLQPTQLGLGTTNVATDLWKVNFEYGAQNNGNPQSQTITVPTVGAAAGFTATQSYIYDHLNRLQSAEELIGTAQTWKQTYSYDRFGNRRFNFLNNGTTTPLIGASNTPLAPKVVNPEIDPANNRLTQNQDGDAEAYLYDAAGNMTRDALGRRFEYDAENKQKKVIVPNGGAFGIAGEYFYDGDGRRVKKIAHGTGEVTIFVYDAAGNLAAEYSNNVAANTQPQTSYLTMDHLGSPRVVTNGSGAVTSRRDFLPFGEEIGVNSPQTIGRSGHPHYVGDNVRQKFTGYEKDSETGLDFAQARMYGGSHGRFTSPDPLMASAKTINPQTFNRYAYVVNNPLTLIDPSGMKPVWLRMNNSDGSLTSVRMADDEDEGYQGLLKEGWQTVTYDENGQFSYSADDGSGGSRTAILTNDGKWHWQPPGLGARLITNVGIGATVGAVSGTEELPVLGTAAYGLLGGILAAAATVATTGVVQQVGPPAVPIATATPAVVPIPAPTTGPTPCGPCRTRSGTTVPVGTMGYRPLDNVPPNVVQHGVAGPHHNVFRANQAPLGSPQPCRCFWQPMNWVIKPPPPSNWLLLPDDGSQDFVYP